MLLPPKHINSFKEYPLLHIADRNFQIRSIKDNNKVKNDIQEYLLNEGDGLFIPKYWIHQIETDSESMSLVITYLESENSVENCPWAPQIQKDFDIEESLAGVDRGIQINKNTTNEGTYYYEIGKEIDYYLYMIDGMNTVFKWNKNWFYYNKYPDDMLIHYNNLLALVKYIFVEYLQQNNNSVLGLNLDIDNIFYQHSLSYEIFIKNNEEDIVIPRY